MNHEPASSLPFDQRPSRRSSCRCSECGRFDSDGTRGPGRIRQLWGRYVRVLGDWLCWSCSCRVWARYLEARRVRLELIYAYRIVGYPMTYDQLDRWKAEQSTQGVQLALVAPTKPRRRRRRRQRTAA